MNRKQFLISSCFLAFLVFNMSCTTEIQLSPMQIRQITTKMFDCRYETAYRASLTVLQDQGYIIKNTDMDSGLIVANVDRSTKTGNQVLQILLVGYAYDKGTEVEVSCIVNELNEFTSEIRINIQEVNYGRSSWLSGTSKQDSKQIYNPEIFQSLFNDINVEIKRREAFESIGTVKEEIQKEEQIVRAESKTSNYPVNLRVAKDEAPLFLEPEKKVIMYISQGTIVKALGKSGDYFYIQVRKSDVNNFIIGGYIHQDFVEERTENKYTKVYLDDGAIIIGEILKENSQEILIKTSFGELTIERKKIKKIEIVKK